MSHAESSQRTGRRFVAPESGGLDHCRMPRISQASSPAMLGRPKCVFYQRLPFSLDVESSEYSDARAHNCPHEVGLGSRPVAAHLPIGARFGADVH